MAIGIKYNNFYIRRYVPIHHVPARNVYSQGMEGVKLCTFASVCDNPFIALRVFMS